MHGRRKKRVLVLIPLALVPVLALSVAASFALNSGGDERQQNLAAIQANEARLLASQQEILSAYNAGMLDYRSLPLLELPADIGQLVDIRFPVSTAAMVAIVRVKSVSFEASGMGDLPAVRTRYTVERVMKGDATVGSTIESTVAGGPYRTSEGKDVYVVLPRGRVDLRATGWWCSSTALRMARTATRTSAHGLSWARTAGSWPT